MHANDLAHLEAELGIRLHEDYRKLLLEYPFKEDVWELMDDPTALLEENISLREADRWGFRWEEYFFWIGNDGLGGFYFLNCRDAHCTVYYLDHGTPAKTIDNHDLLVPCPLREFVDDCKKGEAEFERYEAERQQRMESRQWWQFWIPKRL